MNNSKWLKPLDGINPINDAIIHIELVGVPDSPRTDLGNIPTTVCRTIVGTQVNCVMALIGAMNVQPEIRDIVLSAARVWDEVKHIDLRKKP